MSQARQHYFYKLATNFIRVPVSFALTAIFPRILSPSAYGNFDFLTDSATKFIGFFESGSSLAFYTRLSANPHDIKLVRFYWMMIVAISALYLMFVLSSGVGNFYNAIWPQQNYLLILLSAVWGLVTFISNTTFRMLDAYHETVKAEKFRMMQLVISLLLFAFLFFVKGVITIAFFFLAQIGLLVFLLLGSIVILHRQGYQIIPKTVLTREDLRANGLFFWKYSSPLLLYAFAGLVTSIGDRWILQQFSGSVQQAYFGLSLKVGGLVFIFTSAMIPILTRELAKMHAAGTFDNLRSAYIKNIRLLLFLATFLATIISCNADFIVSIFGGTQYQEAGFVISIMAFYPVHQTLGQINGTLFYATSRTKQYTRVGISVLPLGLLLSFFLMAPRHYFGLHLGAKGLAIQMIVIQLIAQNILLYFNCRYIVYPFTKMIIFQISSLALLSVSGIAIKQLLELVHLSMLASAFFFCFLFSLCVSAFVLMWPALLGFNSWRDILNFKKLLAK